MPTKGSKLSMLLIITMLICSACQSASEEGEKPNDIIPLDELITLSEKDTLLNWDDFNNYSFEDIGSGFYIRKYKIEGGHELIVTGRSLESPPEKIYVVSKSGKEMDLTNEPLEGSYDDTSTRSQAFLSPRQVDQFRDENWHCIEVQCQFNY